MVQSSSVVVLVARARDDRSVAGFVSGAVSPGTFYREFIRGHGVKVAPLLAPKALRPSVARRLLETLRHVTRADPEPQPELLSIAVHAAYRREGMGSRLIDALEARLSSAGARRLFVVVGADNGPARTLYERHGFVAVEELELHRGARSVRYRKAL
jgi:ribosomal protein S18 acetylase RimI-like enzyme